MTDNSRAWLRLAEIMFGPQPAASDDFTPWRQVIEHANANLITASLWSRIRLQPALIDSLSGEEREYLEHFDALTRSRNEAIRQQTIQAANSLHSAGIEVLALKGAAYLLDEIGDAGTRFFTDIDLLVRPDRADDAREVLLRDGYEDAPQGPAEPDHHHKTPLIHRSLPVAVELHTAVAPDFLARAISTDEVWAAARPIQSGGLELLIPEPSHAAAISFLHAELVDRGTVLLLIPLRQFLDLHWLIDRHGSDIDWSGIADRAHAVGGATRLRRYAYVFEQLTGRRLLPDVGYSMADSTSYRLSMAAIDRPSIIEWRRRMLRLSASNLRKRHGIDGGFFALSGARMREVFSMLRNAITRRNDAID